MSYSEKTQMVHKKRNYILSRNIKYGSKFLIYAKIKLNINKT